MAQTETLQAVVGAKYAGCGVVYRSREIPRGWYMYHRGSKSYLGYTFAEAMETVRTGRTYDARNGGVWRDQFGVLTERPALTPANQ